MGTQRRFAILSEQVGGPVSALFGLFRHWGQRSRNLAEFKTLDADRLQDIGLTEHARAQLICSN